MPGPSADEVRNVNMTTLAETHAVYVEAIRRLMGEEIDEGIDQAVDPDFKMTLPKCMMRGDDHCIYRWEKE